MHALAALCVRRPVFATVLILILVVFGVFGYLNLGLDRFPKVDIPMVTVTTRLPGSAPEEVETEITDKIEEAVNTVSGIDELRSVSSEGISQVFIMFLLEKDVDVAAQEVRDRVNRILAELPEDVEQPSVEKMDPDAAPVLTLAVSAPVEIKDLTEYCDKVLRRQLESVEGVGQVMVVGGQKRQINVYLDPLKLRAHGLTVADVARALGSQNLQIPGGTIKAGASEYTLRTLGRVGAAKELESIAVTTRADHTIAIGDLGRVEDGVEEAASMAQFNDTPAVLLNVRKQSGTNTVAVVDRVKERLAAILPNAPKSHKIEIVRDQSVFIVDAVNTVKEHLVLGAILAAVVVFFFLANLRTTVISALAIPTSIISAFAAMHYMGFTLNSLTLLALTLSVGIVIDDAIVVLENIYRYIDEKDYKPFDAALAATREIGMAVLSITLSLVAVFLPIAFMGGIVGRFLKSFGITMASAILVSMLVSFTLTPMLAARWLRKARQKSPAASGPTPSTTSIPSTSSITSTAAAEPAAEPLANGRTEPEEPHSIAEFEQAHAHSSSKSRGLYRWIERTYLALLRFSMRFRWLVALTCLALLVSIPFLMGRTRKNFLPDDDQSEFQVSIRAPEGMSLEATQVLVARIAREIRQLNGVRYTIASTADTEQQIPNLGGIYVRLVDVSERTFSQMEIMDFARRNILPKYAGENLRVSITPAAAFSGGGFSSADVQFMIAGPDMKRLENYAGRLLQWMKQLPGAVDVDSSLVVGKPQFGVTVDRAKAANLGVSVADIAQTLRLLVAGDKASDYNEKGEQYEVHVRGESQYRNNVDQLGMVTVPSTKLGAAPLGDFVKFEQGTGPAQINRLNRSRQVTLSCNMTSNASQTTILNALAEAAKELNMGPDYKSGLLGRSKEMARMMRGFLLVFIMAFVFVYLVIAAQFESWVYPLAILMAFPLTLPFALISLLFFNQSLNVFSILGVLVLFAVVKKNAILQIDHTNQLRAAGMSRYDAIIAANLDRLRPILMTTVAFVCGMIPLLVSSGAGAATNKTISSVVIGGQTLSLLLTLLATPVIYSILDDVAHWRPWRRPKA
ncbi:MAG: efflux RND transporter permease subunit [Candidatus Sumerlaeota bacterium]|nr:efflux RND transporter permease subunit [Candidatus Sumerlaeota bacterium]